MLPSSCLILQTGDNELTQGWFTIRTVNKKRFGLLTLLLAGVLPLALRWARDPIRLRAGEHRGIDVSAHQGKIDWPAVRAAGIEFAYIKASEGGDWVDDRFQENWKGAAAAGIRRGAYHFFTLRRPGAEQAENFLKVAPPEAGALQPVVDLEFGGNTSARPQRDLVVRQLGIFIQRVESAYKQPILLYLLPEFEETYGVYQLFPRQIWLRSLLTRPPSAMKWLLWQYTPLGRVPGIEGDVDLNICR